MRLSVFADALIHQKKKSTPKVGKKAVVVAVKGKKKVVKEQRKDQRVKKTVVVHVPKAVVRSLSLQMRIQRPHGVAVNSVRVSTMRRRPPSARL